MEGEEAITYLKSLGLEFSSKFAGDWNQMSASERYNLLLSVYEVGFGSLAAIPHEVQPYFVTPSRYKYGVEEFGETFTLFSKKGEPLFGPLQAECISFRKEQFGTRHPYFKFLWKFLPIDPQLKLAFETDLIPKLQGTCRWQGNDRVGNPLYSFTDEKIYENDWGHTLGCLAVEAEIVNGPLLVMSGKVDIKSLIEMTLIHDVPEVAEGDISVLTRVQGGVNETRVKMRHLSSLKRIVSALSISKEIQQRLICLWEIFEDDPRFIEDQNLAKELNLEQKIAKFADRYDGTDLYVSLDFDRQVRRVERERRLEFTREEQEQLMSNMRRSLSRVMKAAEGVYSAISSSEVLSQEEKQLSLSGWLNYISVCIERTFWQYFDMNQQLVFDYLMSVAEKDFPAYLGYLIDQIHKGVEMNRRQILDAKQEFVFRVLCMRGTVESEKTLDPIAAEVVKGDWNTQDLARDAIQPNSSVGEVVPGEIMSHYSQLLVNCCKAADSLLIKKGRGVFFIPTEIDLAKTSQKVECYYVPYEYWVSVDPEEHWEVLKTYDPTKEIIVFVAVKHIGMVRFRLNRKFADAVS